MTRRRLFGFLAALPFIGRLPAVRAATVGRGGLTLSSMAYLKQTYSQDLQRVFYEDAPSPFFAALERRGPVVTAVDRERGIITLDWDA